MEKFREVEEKDGKEMAERLNMDYIEVSAATGHNLEQLMQLFVEKYKLDFERLK